MGRTLARHWEATRREQHPSFAVQYRRPYTSDCVHKGNSALKLFQSCGCNSFTMAANTCLPVTLNLSLCADAPLAESFDIIMTAVNPDSFTFLPGSLLCSLISVLSCDIAVANDEARFRLSFCCPPLTSIVGKLNVAVSLVLRLGEYNTVSVYLRY